MESFADQLADWLTLALADTGVRLVQEPRDAEVLRDGLVRSLPEPLRKDAFPVTLEDVHGRLRSLFTTVLPERRLTPGSSAADFRALIAAQAKPVSTERFYQLVFQGELPDMLWTMFAKATRQLMALGGTAPDSARMLDQLGLVELVHNEVSGTVHGPVVQAGTIYGGVHLSTMEPAIGESPIIVTVSTSCVRSALLPGSPPLRVPFSGSTEVELLVEAKGARAVVLTRLRPVVDLRRKPRANLPTGLHLGALEPHSFRALLESEPPALVPEGKRFLRRKAVTDFPFTVAPLDPGLFVIAPYTKRLEIEWHLELDWVYQGRRGTTVLDDNGTPFLIAPGDRPS